MQVIGVFNLPNVSAGPPRHAPHPLGPSRHPASASTSSMLFSLASLATPRRLRTFMSRCTSVEPGTTYVGIFTLFPLRMLAAKIMSVIFPPVHEPMYARSSFTSRQLWAVSLLSGEWGLATRGSMVERFHSWLLKYFSWGASR